jgi:putative sterol carrier protein
LKVLGELRGDDRSPYLSRGEQRFFVVYLNDGKCTDYHQVHVPPPRKEFDFIFEIPAAIFEEVAAGLADPVAAGLKGTIKVTSDMRILIRHDHLAHGQASVREPHLPAAFRRRPYTACADL